VAYLGLAKLGAVAAGVNPRLTADERAQALDVLGPDLVLAPDQSAGSDGGETVPVARAEMVDDVLSDLRVPGRGPPGLGWDPDRSVAIVLTSGTTGTPRGAVFSNHELCAVTASDVGGGWGGGGPTIPGTQLAHVGFMTKLAGHLRVGATAYLMDRWRASDVLDLVERHRMPVLGGVAAQIALLLREPDLDERDLSCVRGIVVGAGPSPPALVEEAMSRIGAPYPIRYSSTESAGVGCATAFDADDEEALHTVGRPRAGVEVQIRDDEERVLGPGEVGRVCLRSPCVMAGYWRDPAATAAALRGGWLHTGDLGLVDDAGRLRLVGRSTEMFIRGGYNVFPQEVEAVLGTHPGVADVVVVPRPDPVMGEVGVAVLVATDPDRPPDLEELRRFAGDRLASHKLPEAVRVVEALGLTAGDKIDRAALVRELREAEGREVRDGG